MPSFFLNIVGSGNLTNISLNKIRCIPFLKKVKNNNSTNFNQFNYVRYVSQLSGNIKILNNFNRGINSISIPNFYIKSNIMNKKLFILGAFYYNQKNSIKIPKISFFSGKNKGFIAGSISKRINISSSINVNNLEYFLPNLKGSVVSTFNIYGCYFSPIISSWILGEKLNWNNTIYLNNMRIFIHMNSNKDVTKNIFLTIKKIKFLNII